MIQACQSTYRGYAIVTHCRSSEPDVAATPGQYVASYTVQPPNRCDGCWQRFPQTPFDTQDDACASARRLAMQSIDHDIHDRAGRWDGACWVDEVRQQ